MHIVDALAMIGEEGRGRLRKVLGSCQRTVIQEYPNEGTHPKGYWLLNK